MSDKKPAAAQQNANKSNGKPTPKNNKPKRPTNPAKKPALLTQQPLTNSLQSALLDKNLTRLMSNPLYWRGDGIDHIRISGQGKEPLGRLLMFSNYLTPNKNRAPVNDPIFGSFLTVRGYRGFITSKIPMENLRTLFRSKDISEVMAQCRAENLYRKEPMLDYLTGMAIFTKFSGCQEIREMMEASTLPFDIYDEDPDTSARVRHRDATWMLPMFEEIRTALKERRQPDFSEIFRLPKDFDPIAYRRGILDSMREHCSRLLEQANQQTDKAVAVKQTSAKPTVKHSPSKKDLTSVLNPNDSVLTGTPASEEFTALANKHSGRFKEKEIPVAGAGIIPPIQPMFKQFTSIGELVESNGHRRVYPFMGENGYQTTQGLFSFSRAGFDESSEAFQKAKFKFLDAEGKLGLGQGEIEAVVFFNASVNAFEVVNMAGAAIIFSPLAFGHAFDCYDPSNAIWYRSQNAIPQPLAPFQSNFPVSGKFPHRYCDEITIYPQASQCNPNDNAPVGSYQHGYQQAQEADLGDMWSPIVSLPPGGYEGNQQAAYDRLSIEAFRRHFEALRSGVPCPETGPIAKFSWENGKPPYVIVMSEAISRIPEDAINQLFPLDMYATEDLQKEARRIGFVVVFHFEDSNSVLLCEPMTLNTSLMRMAEFKAGFPDFDLNETISIIEHLHDGAQLNTSSDSWKNNVACVEASLNGWFGGYTGRLSIDEMLNSMDEKLQKKAADAVMRLTPEQSMGLGLGFKPTEVAVLFNTAVGVFEVMNNRGETISFSIKQFKETFPDFNPKDAFQHHRFAPRDYLDLFTQQVPFWQEQKSVVETEAIGFSEQFAGDNRTLLLRDPGLEMVTDSSLVDICTPGAVRIDPTNPVVSMSLEFSLPTGFEHACAPNSVEEDGTVVDTTPVESPAGDGKDEGENSVPHHPV